MTLTMARAFRLLGVYAANPERVSKARLAEMLKEVVALRAGTRRFVCTNLKCIHNCHHTNEAVLIRQSLCLRYPTQKTMLTCLDKQLEEVKFGRRKQQPA